MDSLDENEKDDKKKDKTRGQKKKEKDIRDKQ
jgi:hypothetical protein